MKDEGGMRKGELVNWVKRGGRRKEKGEKKGEGGRMKNDKPPYCMYHYSGRISNVDLKLVR